MPNFAANLSHLWTEIPFLDRFDAAAEAGFTGVEVLFPYDTPAQDTLAALSRNELHFVLLNAPPPNYTGGDRGYAAVPGLEKRFAYDLRRAIRYASALKAENLHIMAGKAEGDAARDTFVENLRHAVDTVPEGLRLTIEPLNPKSMPGYFLNDFDLAADIIETIGSEKLALQYDTFHAQEITGDALGTFRAHRDMICHIQVGDSPGRTAPGTGAIDFKSFFAAVKQSNYSGWISAEYSSDGRTEENLKWLKNV
ncbi:MAG: TIM barrel protein [Paracoccaceae bacterium]